MVALASRRRDGATVGLLHRRRQCRDGSHDTRCVGSIGGRAVLPVVGVSFGGSNVVVVLVEPHRDPPTRDPGLGRAGELCLLGTVILDRVAAILGVRLFRWTRVLSRRC